MSPAVASNKRKRGVICVSSSSSEEDEDEEELEEDQEDQELDSEGEDGEGSDDDDDDEDEDDGEEFSSEDGSDYAGDEDDADRSDDEEENKENDDDSEDGQSMDESPTEEQLYNKIIDLLQRQRSLAILKLKECKAYLRKHKLRLSGNKATCIERVLEHWRIKDGNGDKLYPRSSFIVNCTGDACKGDIIMFRQRVYDKFDKVTRGGKIIGKRIVAGRIIKESYGSAKQQHTFTVEVLWSKGIKPLPPLYPLHIKGRNLYKLKTFRQRWKNEAERSKILAEKHKRGAAARHARDIRKAKYANKGLRCQRNFSDSRPSKKQKKQEPKDAARQRKQNVLFGNTQDNANKMVKQVLEKRKKRQPEHDTQQKKHSVPHINSQIRRHQNMEQVSIKSISSSRRYSRHVSYPEQDIHMQHTFPQRNAVRSNCNTLPVFHQANYMAPSHANRWADNGLTQIMGYSMRAPGCVEYPAFGTGEFVGHPYGSVTSLYDVSRSRHPLTPPGFVHGPTLPSAVKCDRWRP